MVCRQGEIPDHELSHPATQLPVNPAQVVPFPEFPNLEHLSRVVPGAVGGILPGILRHAGVLLQVYRQKLDGRQHIELCLLPASPHWQGENPQHIGDPDFF